jgi:hypothetical protein
MRNSVSSNCLFSMPTGVKRRLAAAEAAQETAKAEGAIERLRTRAGALGDGGSRDRRGSAEGKASPRLGYVR